MSTSTYVPSLPNRGIRSLEQDITCQDNPKKESQFHYASASTRKSSTHCPMHLQISVWRFDGIPMHIPD